MLIVTFPVQDAMVAIDVGTILLGGLAYLMTR